MERDDLLLFDASIPWKDFFQSSESRSRFEKEILAEYLLRTRWFGGKAKTIINIIVDTNIPVQVEDEQFVLLILKVSYNDNTTEYYFLPVGFTIESPSTDHSLKSVLCYAKLADGEGIIIDGIFSKTLQEFIFLSISQQSQIQLDNGGLLNFLYSEKNKITAESGNIDSHVLNVEQSNTSVVYNNKYFFKIYRKIEREINPEIELVRFLTEKTKFENVPLFAGGLEYQPENGGSVMLGLLQNKVDNQGDSWEMALDSIGHYYKRILSNQEVYKNPPTLIGDLILSFEDCPDLLQDLIGRDTYERIILLGERTAEMHLALASDTKHPDFAPEPFTPDYQHALFRNFQHLVDDRFGLLEMNVERLPDQDRTLAIHLLKKKDLILKILNGIKDETLMTDRTRVHGDYHLGQVLYNGKDFIIIDFEGEPGVSFSERRFKKCPIKDVAGMIRSFYYASFGKIALSGNYDEDEIKFLEPWAEQWQHYILRFYLKAYYRTKYGSDQISNNDIALLRIYLLEKAVYELGYELNSRLDWVNIPLKGIEYLLNRYTDK
jgi:maltose alpha-D-glucosyltransferase/alpha-amylase